MTNIGIKLKATVLLGIGVTVFGACDVTNPGPVQDEFLALPASQPGLVKGIVRSMNLLIGDGAYTLALLSREIFPGGQTGAFGHDVIVQGGDLNPGTFGAYWNRGMQARFIGETAIQRFTEAGSTDELLFQSHLWTGYAYRYLADWWCDAVVGSTDPTSQEPGQFEQGTDTWYERALANFDAALGFASTDEQRFRAHAGRAQAFVGLGQWGNAATAAAQITDPAFVFQVPMSDLEETTYNQVMWGNARTPYAAYSMENTFFKSHWDATGDPRARYEVVPSFPFANASLAGVGQIPYSNQTKYAGPTDGQNMASYWEMRLILAEAILQQTPANFGDAMTLINEVHTRFNSDLAPNDPLPALTPLTADEAWTALKRERYLELFLEGRRAHDEARWASDGSGGTIDTPAWELSFPTGPFVPVASRDLCFDIPDSEREQNPNVPLTGS